MGKYQQALSGLNEAQLQAVTTIDGPVLVIAGPGTGKTQLLTTRIAHILATTDTLPENILCLTFTESAASTMRTRLAEFIGQAAYDVTISTYHAFGSDLIRRYPDYFVDMGDMQPIDDLGADTIYRALFEGLPYSNPLKFVDVYMMDVKTFISDAKRALLTPDDLRAVADQNDAFISKASTIVARRLQSLNRVDKKSLPLFEDLLTAIQADVELPAEHNGILPLGLLCMQELTAALEDVAVTGKTNSITKWKNAWLVRDHTGQFIINGTKTNQKLRAAATIYAQYLDTLQERRLFDFDDMIMRAVRALEAHDDLKFTLQERHQYILLDEFQDTNGAQLRLVELLTDNPASEGRPNVLAVGDDDQAIYAFQGANYSHMLQFQQSYQDVLVVPLTKNYRSHADVLHTAQGIAEQIEERLHHHFPAIEKTLTAENTKLPTAAVIECREAKSDIAQFAWTARTIKSLIEQGIPAHEIAVLAPQHKYLEPLVPFLQEQGIPVRYDKRENILDDPTLMQLVRMSELVLSLGRGQHHIANALWAEVLSMPFWGLPTSTIWQLSWQANDNRENWAEVLLEHQALRPIVLFFIRLGLMSTTETLETMIDYLIGVVPLDLQETDHSTFTSPFYAHYFEQHMPATQPGTAANESRDNQLQLDETVMASAQKQRVSAAFWTLLTNLTVLRARLRDFRDADSEHLHLADFIRFVEAHRAANIKVLNTSPYQESDEAVQLMTAFKSKGMEFEAVFVLAVSDEVWGNKARGASNRLTLPQNLTFIRYAGATNDERLRLFYVALTRAKTHLYMINYAHTYGGKAMTRLKYLDESTDNSVVVSRLLPATAQSVLPADASDTPLTTELSAYWQRRHETSLGDKNLHALLAGRLETFQLSPTHVNSFLSLEYQGPMHFFMNTILRFPKAPIAAGEFGNAIHETLEWIHRHNKQHAGLPDRAAALDFFGERLRSKRLSDHQTEQFYDRGQLAIKAVLEQRGHTFHRDDQSEFNFRSEGVFVGAAHMAGKIDKMIIDTEAKTITIVDYKTGKHYDRWTNEPKLRRYRQQLYLYKALVEGSHTFKNYEVVGAYLEFVEPDENGRIHTLQLDFDAQEESIARQLAIAVWRCIMHLDIPDVSQYTPDIHGIIGFEEHLLRRA